MHARPNEFDERSLAKSSSWGVLAQAVHLASRLLLTSVIVSFIGIGTYAYWSLIFAVLGWLGLHRIGFVTSAIPLVSRCLAQGDTKGAAAFLRGAANLSLLLGGSASLAAALFGHQLIAFLGVNEAAFTALFITLVSTSVALACGGFQSVLEATNRFPRVKGIEVSCAVGECCLSVVFLTAGWGLTGMACAYGMRLLAQAGLCALAVRREFPDLRPWPGAVAREDVLTLVRLGGSMQLIGFVQLSVHFVDRLFAAAFLGLIHGGVFELTRKLVNFGSDLVAQGLGPVAPAGARLRPQNPEAMTDFVKRTVRMVSFFGIVPLAWLAASSESIIHAWLGTVPPSSQLILSVLSVTAYVHLMTGPWTAVLRGMERTKEEFSYSVMWLVLLILLVPAGYMLEGLHGVLAGTTLVAAYLPLAWLVVLTQGDRSLIARFILTAARKCRKNEKEVVECSRP